ncbi:hypothetical protein KR054_002699, partial [Drosophila jambulina]
MDKSVLEWKKTNIYNTIPFTKCPNTAEITCHCVNVNNEIAEQKKIRIVLCDQHGQIHVYFSDWECVSFKSQHTSDTIKLCALTSNSLLVTAIQDVQYRLYIYLYDIRRLTKKQEAPIIASASYPHVISTATCMTSEIIDEKILALSIGFASGDILLHYGKISRDFSANLCRHSISSNPIIGIHFDKLSDILTQNMFITCNQGVYCFRLKDKGFIDKIYVLDNEKSHHNHCCTMRKPAYGDFHESMLVVGREDAMYCYTRDGRGPCFAIEGTKKCLNWEGHYLAIVVKPMKSLLKQTSSTLIIVDTDNKIIVFYNQIQDVFCTISEKDLFFVISRDKDYALILKQHNMSTKIGLLVNQNMYEIALRFLDRDGCASSAEASIVRFQYGNHLLHKGEIGRAVQEYTKTIGFIKPYAVISKLLCSRYNNFLKDYLLELKKKKSLSHNLKLIECCSKRNQLKLNLEHLKDSETNTRLMDVIQVVRLPEIYFTPTLENQCDFIEVNLLNQILEYADKRKNVNFYRLFKNYELEIFDTKSKNLLCFLYILSEHKEYCVRLLTKIINEYSTCKENVYYYLLVLYLELWNACQTTKFSVLDFLNKNSLRLEKVLIICTLYKFSSEIKEIYYKKKNENTVTNNALIKCICKLVESNPEVPFKLNTSKKRFLMMLKKSCTNEAIHALELKPLFKEEIIRDIVDSKKEIKIVQDLNNTLKKSNSILSFYTKNPIEFRNDTCDICRQTLNMQSIYFLCQHTFHKQCLNYNTTKSKEDLKCVICNVTFTFLEEKDQQICNSDSVSVIALISKLVGVGIIKVETETTI